MAPAWWLQAQAAAKQQALDAAREYEKECKRAEAEAQRHLKVRRRQGCWA